LDVQEASENVLLADTVESPDKLKVIHSVRVTPSIVTEASFCCALFHVFMARVRYNLEQTVLIYGYHVGGRTHINHAGENFALNFPTTSPSGYSFQISEESSNTQNFNSQKAIKKKSCFNLGKT
jgi:hypothetical protein